jgi:hypothetical protein
MPKTVSESKFTELLGLDRIALIVHKMRCLWREITKDDFGIDGEIEILSPKPDGKGYHVTGSVIKVQAKSGMSYIVQNSSSHFSAKSSKDDFDLWFRANFPTLFIIYHPEDDKLYWKEMQSYLKKTIEVWRPPFKITFDKQVDVFDNSCLDKMRAIADVSPPRISYQHKEKLYSNLFRITKLPEIIWHASCSVDTRDEVYDAITGDIPPFLVEHKQLYTFSKMNDSDNVFRPLCDISTIKHDRAKTIWPDLRNYVYLLNQMLGRHLRERGLFYNRHHKRNYFPRGDHNQSEFKKEWFNIRSKRKASRIVCKFYKYGLDAFWRHSAARFTFRNIGENWYLQVVPMYFFTKDGSSPYFQERVGPLTTQIKALETNQHVLNHVLFWSNVLSGLGSTSLEIKIGSEEHNRSAIIPPMTIEAVPSSAVANFAIPHDPAILEEPAGPLQTSLFAFFNQKLNSDEEFDAEETDSDIEG